MPEITELPEVLTNEPVLQEADTTEKNDSKTRSLATIQRIVGLDAIPGADAIEVAQILGWHVVVKKGEFKVGDLCVYIQVGSVLPDRPEFDFLRKADFRIKTIKLRKQISQGIAFPLSILPSYSPQPDGMVLYDTGTYDDTAEFCGCFRALEGNDVTECPQVHARQ